MALNLETIQPIKSPRNLNIQESQDSYLPSVAFVESSKHAVHNCCSYYSTWNAVHREPHHRDVLSFDSCHFSHKVLWANICYNLQEVTVPVQYSVGKQNYGK
jgi:hypothetical protein